MWVIKNYPILKDSQICKLIGTTKPTIEAIRNGTHKDSAVLKPKNPVTIGLCAEIDIEKAILSAQPKPIKEKKVKEKKPAAKKPTTKKTTTKTSDTIGVKKSKSKKIPQVKVSKKKKIIFLI